jgi:hypothetical protein
MQVHVKCSFTHVQYIPQPHCQSIKLRNMTIGMKTKILIKFGASEMMSVEVRAKKLYKFNVYRLPLSHVKFMLILAHNNSVHTHKSHHYYVHCLYHSRL